VAPALPHARQRGRGAAVPGGTARVPRLPRLAADRVAGPGRDRLLASAAGPDGRGGLRRPRRVLTRWHADVRRARAPRDQAALVLAAEPAAAQRGPAGPVLAGGRRRGRRAAGLRHRRRDPGLRRLRGPAPPAPPAGSASGPAGPGPAGAGVRLAS